VTVNLHRDRPAPPLLEAEYPPCSLCGRQVESDGDYFRCPNCQAYWHMDHAFYADGGWEEPDAKRCTSTYTSGRHTERCVLHRGHHSETHRAPTPAGYVWRWLG
jgi:hypothetical protein